MENLYIPKTLNSFEVDFNVSNGNCKLTGSSYPENAPEFFKPVFAWVNKYASEIGEKINFIFTIDYLNSGSIKLIFELVELLDKLNKVGIDVNIDWHYKYIDEDIKELGEEFVETVTCKFNLIED